MPTMHITLATEDTSSLRINPKKTIFWVGAGASCELPSGLPLGNALTDRYLELALGPRWKRFAAVWNTYFPRIKNSVKDGKWCMPAASKNYKEEDVEKGDAKERPRLEYVVGEMDKLDRYFNSIPFHNPDNTKLFSRQSSLRPLEHFGEIEPNYVHMNLANFARQDAVIVTTNFDNGIEKALGVDSTIIDHELETTSVKNGRGGYIYHIHGIATDDLDNLAVTIGKMSKGLSQDFEDYLIRCFEDGYDLVFVGYGGVDFFDVEPFFRRLKEKRYRGKAIYSVYCRNMADVEKRKKEEKTYAYLLEPFNTQIYAYGNNEELFRAVADSCLSMSTSAVDCGAYEKTCKDLSSIALGQEDSELYYFLNAFRLCSQLNISPGRIYEDWIQRIQSIFERWEADGKDTIERMTFVDGQKNDGIIDDIYSNNWRDKEYESTKLSKKLSPYIKQWEKKHRTRLNRNKLIMYFFPLRCVQAYVDQTYEILKKMRTDEESIDIYRSTIFYLCGWRTKCAMRVYSLSFGLFKRRLLFIKKSIQRLLNFSFNRFQYRTHYLSLRRQSGYIEAVMDRKKKEYCGEIQEEWDICMQTPNLYDAGQVLGARIRQAKIREITAGVDELKAIRGLILELRGHEK